MESLEIRHLTTEEIHAILDQKDAGSHSSHLDECGECRERYRQFADVDRQLTRLRSGPGAKAGRDCPRFEDLTALGAGLLSEAGSEEVLRHAAGCDYCGAELASIAAAFSDQADPEEERLIAQLPSSTPEGRRRKAAELAATFESRPERWKHVLGGIAAVAAAVVLAVILWPPSPPDTLLAQAYTERRLMELRWPGAAHAPLRIERGGTGKPAALLEARALIAKAVETRGQQPAWLQAQGRAELVDYNPGAALQLLTAALEQKPGDADLMADLAAAHFQEAEADPSRRPAGFARMVELLSKAALTKPDDPVTLFNLAVGYEKLKQRDQAIETWERYLAKAPVDGWAAEARSRLDNLKSSGAPPR